MGNNFDRGQVDLVALQDYESLNDECNMASIDQHMREHESGSY